MAAVLEKECLGWDAYESAPLHRQNSDLPGTWDNDGRAPETCTGQETKTGAALHYPAMQQPLPHSDFWQRLAGVSSTRSLLRQPKPTTILYNYRAGASVCAFPHLKLFSPRDLCAVRRRGKGPLNRMDRCQLDLLFPVIGLTVQFYTISHAPLPPAPVPTCL